MMMNNRFKGFSLVELMIAVLLGSILMGGIIKLFSSSRSGFTSQQAISRVQETGRLAIEFLAKDIRMAGYTGCLSGAAGNVTNTLNSPDAYKNDFDTVVMGYEVNAGGTVSGSGPALPSSITPNWGTDVLVLSNVGSAGIQVTQNNLSAQLFAQLTSTVVNGCPGNTNMYSGLCDGDILMVSDCQAARIFQATNIQAAGVELNIVHAASGTPGNVSPASWDPSNPVELFGPGSEIFKMQRVTYFIRNNTAGQPALFQDINGTVTELLEGVEDMSITYGVDNPADTDLTPAQYLKASAVTAANWNNVLSVRISLLVRSIEDNALMKETKIKSSSSSVSSASSSSSSAHAYEQQSITFDGVTFIPSDRRLRQVFVDTIGIRSRLH